MNPFFVAVAIFASAATYAGEVYKYRMPDGKILYTSQVSTSGKLLEVLPEPAPGPKVIEAERLAKLKREQDQANNATAKRLATLDAVEAEIKAALRALEAAREAVEQSVEPLPGERRGTAKGTSRLTEGYWERQRELRQAVEAARQRLDDAYRARDAIR